MDTTNDVIAQKVLDLDVPGVEVAFDPEEAEALGAFVETALEEADARASVIDLAEISAEEE